MSSPSFSSLSDSGVTEEDWQRGWLGSLLWVTATPFPPHLPVPIGCSGLCHPTAGTTDTPDTLGLSHIRQSQLGSFTNTKFIPEDPLHGTISSHHRGMLHFPPLQFPHRPPSTSSPRPGYSHMVARAGLLGSSCVHVGQQWGWTP